MHSWAPVSISTGTCCGGKPGRYGNGVRQWGRTDGQIPGCPTGTAGGGSRYSRSCTTSERLEALYDSMGGTAFLEPTQGPLA